MPQADYLERLTPALAIPADPRSLFKPMAGPEAVFYALQPTTQAS